MRIVVLQGGPSAERAISLESGEAVARSLAAVGHCVSVLDPNSDLSADAEPGSAPLIEAAERAVRERDWSGVDVVFNALHGTFGEDGSLQALLDRLGVAYTGSGVAASRCGFRKSIAKRRFRLAGVPTPRGVTVSAHDPFDRLELAAASLGYPVVLKPEAQGSSLGVSIVSSSSDLEHAAAQCFTFGDEALLEEYIPGAEWTVPVWDEGTLPVIEIRPRGGFFDYAAKYSDDLTEYECGADVSNPLVERIAETGRSAARAIGAVGLSRADVRVRPDGAVFVLEVNTSPGMTDHSLVPKSAAQFGLSLGELCERECRRAIARHAGRRRPRSAA